MLTSKPKGIRWIATLLALAALGAPPDAEAGLGDFGLAIEQSGSGELRQALEEFREKRFAAARDRRVLEQELARFGFQPRPNGYDTGIACEWAIREERGNDYDYVLCVNLGPYSYGNEDETGALVTVRAIAKDADGRLGGDIATELHQGYLEPLGGVAPATVKPFPWNPAELVRYLSRSAQPGKALALADIAAWNNALFLWKARFDVACREEQEAFRRARFDLNQLGFVLDSPLRGHELFSLRLPNATVMIGMIWGGHYGGARFSVQADISSTLDASPYFSSVRYESVQEFLAKTDGLKELAEVVEQLKKGR